MCESRPLIIFLAVPPVSQCCSRISHHIVEFCNRPLDRRAAGTADISHIVAGTYSTCPLTERNYFLRFVAQLHTVFSRENTVEALIYMKDRNYPNLYWQYVILMYG